MNVRLACLELWTPSVLCRGLLDELTACVAGAFGCPPPEWRTPSYEERLREFAAFTAREAMSVPAGERRRFEAALRRAAEEMGRRLRRRMVVRTDDDARRAIVLLYRRIGIDAVIAEDGEVVVHDCLFSSVYSPEVCRLMCAVDDGIAAGVSGGGGLSFTRRLTEGCPECRGRFVVPGGPRHTDAPPVAATSRRGAVS